jgi:hypothetical protein
MPAAGRRRNLSGRPSSQPRGDGWKIGFVRFDLPDRAQQRVRGVDATSAERGPLPSPATTPVASEPHDPTAASGPGPWRDRSARRHP